MRIIFFGTPDYVIPILSALRKEFNKANREQQLVAVVTQPPKPAGRNKIPTRSAVDNWAWDRHFELITDLAEVPEADIGVLAAYGQIIPKSVLEKFEFGILNIHPSLLPKYRGASPVQAAIAAGEETTGVSVIKMDEKLDHGPVVSSFKEKIKDDDTAGSLRERLFERSAEFVVKLIPAYVDGKVKPKAQNHKRATFTNLIKKAEAYIKPEDLKKALDGKNANKIHNFIRAMNPWPFAWTRLRLTSTRQATEKRLKLIKAHLAEGKLVLDEVQLEGKNPVSWDQFKEGYPEVRF